MFVAAWSILKHNVSMTQDMPDTSKKAIGERIVAVREARDWSQAELARLLDESPQRWGNYERGDRVPPPPVLAKLWRLTGATSDYVLFGQTYGLPLDLVKALDAKASENKKAG